MSSGVERAGLPVPKAKTIAHLPGCTLLQKVKSVLRQGSCPTRSCLHPRSSLSGCENSTSSCRDCCLGLCSGVDLSSREKLLMRAGRQQREEGLGTSLLAFLVIKQEFVFSGIIGSGLCVFSRHPIQEITQHVYTLNGYPYMVRISPLSLLTQTGHSLLGALAGRCQYPEFFLSSLAYSSITETGSVGRPWDCWCSI